jgi:hypothetical protein
MSRAGDRPRWARGRHPAGSGWAYRCDVDTIIVVWGGKALAQAHGLYRRDRGALIFTIYCRWSTFAPKKRPPLTLGD